MVQRSHGINVLYRKVVNKDTQREFTSAFDASSHPEDDGMLLAGNTEKKWDVQTDNGIFSDISKNVGSRL